MNISFSDASDFDLPLSVDELSTRWRLAPAFIALVLSLGCPTCVNGKLSLFRLLDWLTENSDLVRVAAVLRAQPPLPATDDPEELAHIKLVRAVATMEEYHGTRTSDAAHKAEVTKLKMALALHEQLLRVKRDERAQQNPRGEN